MRVSLVTPDASFYDGEATKVVLPAWDGELGILPHHAPLIARLGYGVTRVHDGKQDHHFAVYGGFLKVQDDVVTILAGGAQAAEGTLQAAREAHAGAAKELATLRETKGGSPAEMAALEERVKRAQAYVRLLETDKVPAPLT